MRITLLFAFVISFTACSVDTPMPGKEIKVDLNRKELTKLFKGQELYSIKGIKTKFDGKVARVNSIPSKDHHILHVELKKDHYLGSKNFLLHSDLKYNDLYKSLTWFLNKHKLYWPHMDAYEIGFSNKINNAFTFIDIPTKEVIEYNGNRFLQMLSFSSFKENLEIEESEVLELIDLSCYEYDKHSLAVLKVFMDYLELSMNSYDAIKIIPNSITNKLQFVIDFSESGSRRKGISFVDYLEKLNELKPIDVSIIENIVEDQLKERTYQENSSSRLVKQTSVLSGALKVEEDLMFNDLIVTVEAGTEFHLFGNSKIVMEGGICSFQGSVDSPIIIKGLGDNSVFFNNMDSLVFRNVVFGNLANWSDTCKLLPSAITVYNSNVIFSGCRFMNNWRGDDMVNCFHSNFVFEDCFFSNVLSDAFDSDFSEGEVLQTEFVEIGNDGVDCSGSELKISNCKFDRVKDKAISAGENSHISVSNNSIVNSAIGFVAKDGSSLRLTEQIELANNDLDFAVFMKKPFYAYPSLEFDSDLSKYKYLFQDSSQIISSSEKLVFLQDVESKLYGNEFGKASK